LVGQNLGVRKTDRAVKSTLIGVLLIAIFSLLCCLIILIWAEGIVRLFNTDPLLVGIGATFLRIATVCYFIMGLTSAFTSCLNGAGDTLSTMIINIGMIWVFQIPLAYILSNHTSLDVNGVRWAMVISTGVAAIATFAYFLRGKWKVKSI
jgi:Na+-driven multidrug efflux pump